MTSKATRLRGLAVDALVVAAGALVFLLPALIASRPFIFYDTWEFYAWGHDVLAAIGHPWPATGPFPVGRELWISTAFKEPVTIDETGFRLVMSQVGARSAFYGVPLFALGSLWFAAVVQALLASWTLWVAVRAFDWQPRGLAFLGIVAALTAATTLPFFTAFMMPDVFAGLATLAAGLLLFFPDRVRTHDRWGLLALIVYGVVAHTSNIALLLAAIAIGVLIIGFKSSLRAVIELIGPVVGALVAGLVLLALESQGLKAVFGRPVQNAPFLLGRIIADGSGLAFLKERCARTAFVACELTKTEFKDNFIWAYDGKGSFSFLLDPDRRERFYAEQAEIVLAAIARDPVSQIAASLRNTFKQLASFRVRPEMNNALTTILSEDSPRAWGTASITPNVEACRANHGQGCNAFLTWKLIDIWHYAIVASAGLLLAIRLTPVLTSRERRRALEPEQAFAVFVGFLVLANAFICGALSGPYDRYQARIVWLIPFATLMLESRYDVLKSILDHVMRRFRA